jgi:hypothetical protein
MVLDLPGRSRAKGLNKSVESASVGENNILLRTKMRDFDSLECFQFSLKNNVLFMKALDVLK